MLVRHALKEYRTWSVDSRRWLAYQPKAGDIVVATYPKCGTTWMQRIVNLLIFQSAEPQPVSKLSPWYDMRIAATTDEINEVLAAQTHRRAVKTHLPFDGLPIFKDTRYIHVARDGRDACLSYHNHCLGLMPEIIDRFSKAGLDDPNIAKPFPAIPRDPAEFFHLWLTQSHLRGQITGYLNLPFFDFHHTYWAERESPSVLLVHYADLKRDLSGEMRRVASFLQIAVDEETWPALVNAATFETMKKQGRDLMPNVMALFDNGADRFFNKAETGRWREVFHAEDLALYESSAAKQEPAFADWLAGGRHMAGDPQQAA
jgi:aryl sulfotransferase